MIKEQRHIEIFGSVASVSPVLTSKKLADSFYGELAFFISKNLYLTMEDAMFLVALLSCCVVLRGFENHNIRTGEEDVQ
jgi:hypothetical protein